MMTSSSHPPVMILMKGHPGSGKSTLARALARALRCPLVDKDDARDCFQQYAARTCSISAAAVHHVAAAAATAAADVAASSPSAAAPATASSQQRPAALVGPEPGSARGSLTSGAELPPPYGVSETEGHAAKLVAVPEHGATGGTVDWNALSYDVMFQVAATQLQLGLNVVVDCPLARPRLYHRATALAQQVGAHVAVVECWCSNEHLWRQRLELRSAQDRVMPGLCAESQQTVGPGVHTGLKETVGPGVHAGLKETVGPGVHAGLKETVGPGVHAGLKETVGPGVHTSLQQMVMPGMCTGHQQTAARAPAGKPGVGLCTGSQQTVACASAGEPTAAHGAAAAHGQPSAHAFTAVASEAADCRRSTDPGLSADRGHKPGSWRELQELLQSYQGCWAWSTNGSVHVPCYVRVDTTPAARAAACHVPSSRPVLETAGSAAAASTAGLAADVIACLEQQLGRSLLIRAPKACGQLC